MRRTIECNLVTLALLFITFVTACEDPMQPGGGPEPELLPVFFSNPAWHSDGEWIAVEHSDSVDTDRDGSFDLKFGGIWLVHHNSFRKRCWTQILSCTLK